MASRGAQLLSQELAAFGQRRRVKSAITGEIGRSNPFIGMCEYRADGTLKGVASVPLRGLDEAKRKNPNLVACHHADPRPSPGSAVNALLDASNDGTFAGARRAAFLGLSTIDATADAINRLANASERGTITPAYAADRIVALASPPLAAQQAGQAVIPLTAAELAEQRRRRAQGLSNTDLLAAQAAKLDEACRPVVCWIEKDIHGKPVAKNVSKNRLAEDVIKDPAFLRFCTKDELGELPDSVDSWGSWAVDNLRTVAAKVGLAEPPRALVIPVPGQPPSTAEVIQTGKTSWLCMDPRIFPQAFRPQNSPCVPPQIEYPG